MAINDCTDPHSEDVIATTLKLIAANLDARIEGCAKYIATSSTHRTEQQKPFVTYVNGAIKHTGSAAEDFIINGDFSSEKQLEAFQFLAERQYHAVIANKPPETDIVIWRQQNECRRALYADGLHLQIYCRLAWEKLRG